MSLAEELQEAVDSVKIKSDDEPSMMMVGKELAQFLMNNPAIIDSIGEDDEAEVMELLDEMAEILEAIPTQDQIFRLMEKKHSPFKNKSDLTTDAAVYGRPNPRSKVKDWDCDCSNFKCSCKNLDTGATKNVNMSKYYGSGRKAKYMDSWREITSKAKK